MCVCVCGFCNVWVCVCVGFEMCGCGMCGFCNVWMYVCVVYVMCGCVYLWDLLCVRMCMCGFCNVCVYVWVF